MNTIKYKELAENPTSGIYKVIESNTYVIVEDNKTVHSPRGMSICDDEELMRI